MKQTMLGLLALMTSMLLSLNMSRASLSATAQVIDNEMETVAGGVALEVLDYIGTKPFDAATATAEVDDANDLTSPPFSTGKSYAEADDIDDFHLIQTHTLSAFEFDFEVDINVEYVDEDDPETASSWQTFAKKVTVTVNTDHLAKPVYLTQVYTYP